MTTTNDQLDWLAFRYVAGELAADEEERFEQRLADDQAAREAVEQTAELSDAIRLVAAESLELPRAARLSAVRQTACVAVTLAGLLLAAFVFWPSPSDAPSNANSADSTGETPVPPRPAEDEDHDEDTSTALAWARLRAPQTIDSGDSDVDEWNRTENELAGTSLVGGERVDGELPLWLLTAIVNENETKEGDR